MSFKYRKGDSRSKPKIKLVYGGWQVVGESFSTDSSLLEEAYIWCRKMNKEGVGE